MTSKLILSLITASVLFAAPVSAEETGAAGGTFAACKTDVDALCKDAGEGRGAGMKCLRENASKVSSACSAALAALPSRNKD